MYDTTSMSAPTQTTLLHFQVNSDSLFSSISVNFTYTVSYQGGVGYMELCQARPFREFTLATSQRHYVRHCETRNVRRRSYIQKVSNIFLQPNRHRDSNQKPWLVKQTIIPLCYSFQLLHTYILNQLLFNLPLLFIYLLILSLSSYQSIFYLILIHNTVNIQLPTTPTKNFPIPTKKIPTPTRNFFRYSRPNYYRPKKFLRNIPIFY